MCVGFLFFILANIFVYSFLFFSLAGNVLALGAVADFGAPNCQYTTKVDTW
jgi:hypothetical protein